MSKSKDKSNKSLVLSDSQWFDRYLKICNTYDKSCAENDLYLDILKDLCNDNISDVLTIHLLSILEQLVPLFDDNDKVEQTVGSLLNIYTSSAKTDWIRQKYLITTTVIITYHSEMTESNRSLKQLYDCVIQLLFKNTENPKTIIGLASVECLREIGSTTPTLLQNAYNRRQLKSNQTLIMSSLLMNSTLNGEDIRSIVSDLPNMSSLDLYHTLSQLFDAIRGQKYQELISPIIFKPFLNQMIFSSEVHWFQFGLQLLLSFGLELFSTLEEQKLLKQLVIVATHPSLTIAHRLLALDYTKSIVQQLKPSSFDSTSLYITSFDGPDTQEKKLTILNETSIDNQNLLICLKPLKTLSLSHNMRATNAFYRVLYSMLQKRSDIMNEIQDLLISVIFKAPDPHIRRAISLFNEYKQLAKGTTHKMIENLLNMSETETFKGLTEFLEFMSAFEWIFKQKDLDLSETQLVFLLRVIHNNTKRWVQSSGRALDCCTAVLYYQPISVSVKQILLSTLEWLMNERKNDLSITSLAQIYILALNTLEDDIDIKKVFNFEDQSFSEEEIVVDLSDDVPFSIKRVKNDQSLDQKFKLNEMPFSLKIMFEINIREQFKDRFERIFALILFFNSSDGSIAEEYVIPILTSDERHYIKLEFQSLVTKPLELSISSIFNDTNGTNFRCNRFQTESIGLKDILLPIEFQSSQSFNELCESVLKHKDSMQTVICIEEFDSIEEFLSHFDWFSNFIIKNSNQLICGSAPDRLLLGSLRVVNDLLNIYLFTNNFEILSTLYAELSPKCVQK